MMSWVQQRYRDVGPVTLQVVGGALSSSLYCGEVEGLSLVESFLVEVFRCKLCQFTCGPRTAIHTHLQLRHRPHLTCHGEGLQQDGDGLQQDASPYQLELNGETNGEEDEEFLLYNMLDSMSPASCDISSQEGLQVAHTCEVSTLFEEDEEDEEEEEEEEDSSSIFPLKEDIMDVSSPVRPASVQEELDQSAHLMTLGLCRISAIRPPPPPPPPPPDLGPPPPAGPAHLLCLLCPLTLPSRRLLDVHVLSHRDEGGFRCIRCTWTSHTWEELEAHWRSHCRRKRRRRRKEQEEVSEKRRRRRREQEEVSERRRRRREQEEVSERRRRKEQEEVSERRRREQEEVSEKRRRRREQEEVSEKRRRRREQEEVSERRTASRSPDQWRGPVIGQAGGKEAELPARSVSSLTSKSQAGPPQSVSETTKTFRRKKNEEEEAESLSCSLCYRKFSSKLTLRRHLGVHGGEKPFTCPHCPYSSRLKASLLQHLRTHTGEKPYKCNECPYASIDRSSLLRHSRTHSQERPYSCQLCSYSSIQKKSLDLHDRRHHTGEVFPCQQCEYSSPDRRLLLKHISRHHAPLTRPGSDWTAGDITVMGQV